MSEKILPTDRFEAERPRLHQLAYRMLGSAAEADDALQEAWLRIRRAGPEGIANPAGWLTTVVSRVCLDLLRTRASRREEALEGEAPVEPRRSGHDPEQEVLLADAVGVAMLVVLDRLTPAERVAFVLHDLFELPFDEIAPIIERTPVATRQLASRARRRVQGAPPVSPSDRTLERELVGAFMAASRDGDLKGLIALLDPDVVRRADRQAVPVGAPLEVRGAEAVARGALAGARATTGVQMALVNGHVGILLAPRGRLTVVLGFRFGGGKIVSVDVIADPARLAALDVHALNP